MKMMRTAILASLVLLPSMGYSSDEYAEYFRDAEIIVDDIVGKRTAVVGDGYEVRAAYGYPRGSTLKGHFVGVFLVKDGALVEVLDAIPSERGLDFFPLIKEATNSHVVISFFSDYGELARRKYVLDLEGDTKLVQIVPLDAEGIPDDLL